MAAVSSRSHSIFTLVRKQKGGKLVALNLIDLGGTGQDGGKVGRAKASKAEGATPTAGTTTCTIRLLDLPTAGTWPAGKPPVPRPVVGPTLISAVKLTALILPILRYTILFLDRIGRAHTRVPRGAWDPVYPGAGRDPVTSPC